MRRSWGRPLTLLPTGVSGFAVATKVCSPPNVPQTLGDGPGGQAAEQRPRGSPGAPPAGTQMVLGCWLQVRAARCQAGSTAAPPVQGEAAGAQSHSSQHLLSKAGARSRSCRCSQQQRAGVDHGPGRNQGVSGLSPQEPWEGQGRATGPEREGPPGGEMPTNSLDGEPDGAGSRHGHAQAQPGRCWGRAGGWGLGGQPWGAGGWGTGV